jgi:hypothetical protein
MIMIPLLILQIFLFPFTAGLMMNGWVDSRRTLALQEAGSNLGSAIQQLYSSLNHNTISTGVVNNALGMPMFIEEYAYSGTGALRSAVDPNAAQILVITLTLKGTNIVSTVSVTLGQNANWLSSNYISNSTNAGISGQKFANGTIQLSFTS